VLRKRVRQAEPTTECSQQSCILRRNPIRRRRSSAACRPCERYPFANAANAMREINRGDASALPVRCRAGYLGVGAGGELAACHRFVGDDDGAFGDVWNGVDRAPGALAGELHAHEHEAVPELLAALRVW
jgi:hypothetical protein